MPTTPNLGLPIFNDTTDAEMDFKTYYNKITGTVGGSMGLIDNAFGLPLTNLTTNNKTLIGAINEIKTSSTKVTIALSNMQNGWGFWSDYQQSITKTGEILTINVTLTPGVLASGTMLIGGLPKISKNCILTMISATGKTYPVIYSADGTTVVSHPVTTEPWFAISSSVTL